MNEFAPAPEWAWQTRVAIFPCEASLQDYLALSPEELDRRARAYAERGVNFVNAIYGFHLRFDWIAQFDELTEVIRRITEACHKAGMRVFEHHSSNFALNLDGTMYRGWDPREALAVDIRSGLPTGQYGKRNASFMCINNRKWKEHVTHYLLNLIERTGVDGLMHDDIHYAGQYYCGCDDCRSNFEACTGYSLPAFGEFPLDDCENPVWRDWLRFRLRSTAQHLRELRPQLPQDFLLFSCMTGGLLTDGDVHHAGASVETFAQGTNCLFNEGGGLSWRNRGGSSPRNFFANWEKLFLEKKYLQAVSNSFQQPAIDMHYPAHPEEGLFCWAMTKLFGQNLWRCDTNIYGGHNYDDEFEEWMPEYDYLRWESDHASLFQVPRQTGDIGLVFSQRSKLNLGTDPQHHAEPWAGWMQALTAAGYVVDGLLDRDLEQLEALDNYAMIVLPNVVSLSDRGAACLRDYVQKGGKLVATHQTSLRDADGAPLANFALADLFGCNFWHNRTGEKISWFPDRRFAADRLFTAVPPRVSAFPGMMIVYDGEDADRNVLAWHEKTPLYHDEPQSPAIVRRRYGAGTVVYLAPRVGGMAYRQGLFPIWYQQYHRQQLLREDEKGRPLCWWDAPADRNGAKWFFVDEGLPAYRSMIANLADGLVPDPRIRVNTPAGIVFNVFRQRDYADGHTVQGNLIIGFLNVAGAQFANGEEIAVPARVEYPRLHGEITIILRHQAVKDANLHSPDLQAAVPLDVQRTGKRITIRMEAAVLFRLGFVQIRCSA